MKKQTGGSGLFADMQFEIGPADQEFLDSDEFKQGKTKMQFVWDIFGGAIDKAYMPSVIKGFESMMGQGILAGYNIEKHEKSAFLMDLCIRLIQNHKLLKSARKMDFAKRRLKLSPSSSNRL